MKKDEILKKCIINPVDATFILFGNLGTRKEIEAETLDQFKSMCDFVYRTIQDKEKYIMYSTKIKTNILNK